MGVEVKICGLTRSVDAELADAAGASYLGVIFAGGPRQRSPHDARATLAGRRARKVGVFAGRDDAEIASIAELVGLDVLQLHEDGNPERLAALRATTGLEIWAVIRTATGALPDGVDELSDAADALLVDAHVAGQLGGTGTAIPWKQLAESLAVMPSRHRLVLAGGLTPTNVAEAIGYVSPTVVDVSSGVESAPGIKDSRMVRAFISAVRATETEA